MTKRDCNLIADVLIGMPYFVFSPGAGGYRTVVVRFADALSKSSPRFNRELFMRACGLTEERT